MPVKDPTQTEINSLNVDVGIIKSQMNDMKRQNDRIEKKIDGMTYASQNDLDEFKREVKETYVTKESFDPVKRLVYGTVGLILIAVVGAVIGATLK